ncbi:MAG: TylF/MycF/NovP-related O-methyltransferase [Candidatus Omnitrophota bacterium]
MEETKHMYLDLMKRSLVNWLYMDREIMQARPRNILEKNAILFLRRRGFQVISPRPVNPDLRMIGRDHADGMGLPAAHTMIGLRRLDNIQFCIESIVRDNVQGDLIETGTWEGGATIFMRAVLKAYAVTDRTVWVADSFEGCPKPNPQTYPDDKGVDLYQWKELAIPLEKVKANFERYGLLDEHVHFLKGWFKDTLPHAPIRALSLLRLDGDLYESTMDILVNLYPKVSPKGYIIIDDFLEIPACRQAVLDFRKSRNITDTIIEIDKDSIYWQRS